jgi:hypothetical protein
MAISGRSLESLFADDESPVAPPKKQKKKKKGKKKASAEESSCVPVTTHMYVDKVVELKEPQASYPVPEDGSSIGYLVDMNWVSEEEFSTVRDDKGDVVMMFTRCRSCVRVSILFTFLASDVFSSVKKLGSEALLVGRT